MVAERQSFRQLIRNYLKSVPPRRLAKVFAEEYLGTFLRSLPGVEGFVLRYLLYRAAVRAPGRILLRLPRRAPVAHLWHPRRAAT